MTKLSNPLQPLLLFYLILIREENGNWGFSAFPRLHRSLVAVFPMHIRVHSQKTLTVTFACGSLPPPWTTI